MDEKNQDLMGYTFKGKIMISAAVILFAACFAIILFHVYTRWCRHRRRRSRRIPIVISPPAWPYAATPQGLDLHAVNALPTFVYSSENQEPPPECAVCLSEFDGGENGRILPDCNHYFHVDCIDMWLESHRDCPLCRTRVKSLPDPDRHEFTVVSIFLLDEPDPVTGCESGSDPNGGSDVIQPCFPSSSESPEKAEGAPNPTLKIRIQDTG